MPSNRQRADLSRAGVAQKQQSGSIVDTPGSLRPSTNPAPRSVAQYGRAPQLPENMRAPVYQNTNAAALAGLSQIANTAVDYKRFLVTREISTNTDLAERDAILRATEQFNAGLEGVSQKLSEGYVLKDKEAPMSELVNTALDSDEFWTNPSFQALPPEIARKVRDSVLTKFQLQAMSMDTDLRVKQGAMLHQKNVAENRRDAINQRPTYDAESKTFSIDENGTPTNINKTLNLRLKGSQVTGGENQFVSDFYKETGTQYFLNNPGLARDLVERPELASDLIEAFNKEFIVDGKMVVDASDQVWLRSKVASMTKGAGNLEADRLGLQAAILSSDNGSVSLTSVANPSKVEALLQEYNVLREIQKNHPDSFTEADGVRLNHIERYSKATALIFKGVQDNFSLENDKLAAGGSPGKKPTAKEGFGRMLGESQKLSFDQGLSQEDRALWKDVNSLIAATLADPDDQNLIRNFGLLAPSVINNPQTTAADRIDHVYNLASVGAKPVLGDEYDIDAIANDVAEISAGGRDAIRQIGEDKYKYATWAVALSGNDQQIAKVLTGRDIQGLDEAPTLASTGAESWLSASNKYLDSRFPGEQLPKVVDFFDKVQGMAYQQLQGDTKFTDLQVAQENADREGDTKLDAKLKLQLKNTLESKTLDIMGLRKLQAYGQKPMYVREEALRGYHNQEYLESFLKVGGVLGPRTFIPEEGMRQISEITSIVSGNYVSPRGDGVIQSRQGWEALNTKYSEFVASLDSPYWKSSDTSQAIQATLKVRLSGLEDRPNIGARVIRDTMADIQMSSRIVSDAQGYFRMSGSIEGRSLVSDGHTFNALERRGDPVFNEAIKDEMGIGLFRVEGGAEDILSKFDPYFTTGRLTGDSPADLKETMNNVDWRTEGYGKAGGAFSVYKSPDGATTVHRMGAPLSNVLKDSTARIMGSDSSEGLDSMHMISRWVGSLFEGRSQQLLDRDENLRAGPSIVNQVFQESGFEKEAREFFTGMYVQNQDGSRTLKDEYKGLRLEANVGAVSEPTTTFTKSEWTLIPHSVDMKPRVQLMHIRFDLTDNEGNVVHSLERTVSDPTALGLSTRFLDRE